MTGGVQRLLRFTQHLNRPSDEVDSDLMRHESRRLGDVVDIGEVRPRQRVTVSGEIRSVTIRPQVDVPTLDVELWDGTGSLHLVWLGRRRIPGIVPGIRLRATGRVTRQRQVTTIFNPAYEIIPPRG